MISCSFSFDWRSTIVDSCLEISSDPIIAGALARPRHKRVMGDDQIQQNWKLRFRASLENIWCCTSQDCLTC